MRNIQRELFMWVTSPSTPLSFTNGDARHAIEMLTDGSPFTAEERVQLSKSLAAACRTGLLSKVKQVGAKRSATYQRAEIKRPADVVAPSIKGVLVSREKYGGQFLRMMHQSYYQDVTKRHLSVACYSILAEAVCVPMAIIRSHIDPWKSHRTRVIQELQQYGYLSGASGLNGLTLTTVFVVDAQQLNPRTGEDYESWFARIRKSNNGTN